MPNIDLSILNQRQTPAFYADVFANRPAAGFVGRIFISTNTFAFYRDNGTSWDLIGGPGTGTVTGTGANGQVTFWNGASTITGSNDLFWDATNGHLGVNTNAPGTALDVHHDQPTVAILNQTVATNDTRIGFQNNGVGLWRIGAFYNAGANDFGIYDAVAAIQPVTVKKTTGQVLIGTSTVGAGKLVVASASSDNGVQIVGASAPSLRIDNAETGATKRAGLGISTATNNFIQGSADRDFCIFNGGPVAASPILFGIYDTGASNTQEAARISSLKNFLIGTTTDTGEKLQVNGTGYVNGLLTVNNADIYSQNGTGTNLSIGFKQSSAVKFRLRYDIAQDYLSMVGSSGNFIQTWNQSGLVGIGTTLPTRILHLSASGTNAAIRLDNTVSGRPFLLTYDDSENLTLINSSDSGYIAFRNATGAGQEILRIPNTRNVLIGTTTDAGQKLQVEGTALMKNFIRLQANTTTSVSTSPTIISTGSNTYGGLAIVWGSDAGGNVWTNLIFYSLGTVLVLASQDVSGGPDGRTYSVDGSGNLRLAMAANTYTVRFQALLTA